MARFRNRERPPKETVSLWSRINGSAKYARLAKSAKPGYHWSAEWAPSTRRTIALLGVTQERIPDERLMHDAEDAMAAVAAQVDLALRVCITCAPTGRKYCVATGDSVGHMIEAD